MSDVISIVEGLDFVVSLAEGHLEAEDLGAAKEVARRARARAGHLGSTMVLALVGGTGSGKSSLLNALAGEEVASTSAIRPHTTEPTAWTPADAEPSLDLLLDRLGVHRRVEHDRFPGLAVLDMTDIDSIEAGHRELVEELLPHVDVVLWVLDPVKYADAALHREFIVPLADASDRLIFVLNQTDRLDAANLAAVLGDLDQRLTADGIADPVVIAVAAAPPGESPRGIEILAEHLRSRLDEKRIHVGKIVDDATQAALGVAGAAGVAGGSSVGFEERWDAVCRTVTSGVARTPAMTAAEVSRIVESFILALSTDTAGAFGTRMRRRFQSDWIETEVREALDAVSIGSPPAEVLQQQLQERIGAPLRTLLWERASLSAVVAGLAVDAATVGGSVGRR